MLLIALCSCEGNSDTGVTSARDSLDGVTPFPTIESTLTNNRNSVNRISVYDNPNYKYIDSYKVDNLDTIIYCDSRLIGICGEVEFDTYVLPWDSSNTLPIYQSIYSGSYPYIFGSEWLHVDDYELHIEDSNLRILVDEWNDEDINYGDNSISTLSFVSNDESLHIVRPTMNGIPVSGVMNNSINMAMTEDGYIGQLGPNFQLVQNNDTQVLFTFDNFYEHVEEVSHISTIISPSDCLNGVITQIEYKNNGAARVICAEINYIVLTDWNTNRDNGFVWDEYYQSYKYTLYPVWTFYYVNQNGVIESVMCDASNGNGILIDDRYFIPYLGI